MPEVVPTNLREKPVRENHEIVKVNLVEETIFTRPKMQAPYQEAENISNHSISSIRIQVADVTLEISESINLTFLSQVLQTVRYML